MFRPYVTLFCILLIIYFFWVDRNNKEGISRAIWIPFIWMFFSGSRPFSFWLNYWFGIGGGYYGSMIEAKMEGNPYERIYLTILIISGFIVLKRRNINWGKLLNQNNLIWMFFIFGGLSLFWSDYPFVTLKRWIKSMGTVIMVLIILTEKHPYQAIGFILRRLAFIFLPLSILFIRYYGELGRTYHHFSGEVMFTGIADHKNSLGRICMVSFIYFTWILLFSGQNKKAVGQQLHRMAYIIIFPMIVWLLYMANSATALACSAGALGLLVVSQQPKFAQQPRKIMAFGIVCMLIYALLQLAFDIKGIAIAMLGRRADLTTRIPMWEDLLSMVKNPLLGFGYESFLLGPRLERVIDEWGIDSQAHNGYLQMYLDLGYIGLFLLITWIVTSLKKISRHLTVDYSSAIFRLCFIVVIALYNYTEATFYGIGNLWAMFFFCTIDLPGPVAVNKDGVPKSE